MKKEVIHRVTFEITLDLTHEQDQLIMEIGNKQRGGHDEVLPDFIKDRVKFDFEPYLKKKLNELKS